MSIKERLVDDVKSAMKSGDRIRLETLRMLRSKVQEAEVRERAKEGRDYQLDDEGTLHVFSSYAKQRRESIDSYRQAGREDLASKEESELAIVQEYLPAQLGPDEIREIVRQTIEEVGAKSPKEMGAVMKAVMPKLKGAADGKLVNQTVRDLLQ